MAADSGKGAKGALQGLVTMALVIVISFGVILFLFGTVVPPGSMGVRQIMFGPGQGFSDDALEPGYHWTIPFYSTVHVLPRTIQSLDFSSSGERDDHARSGIVLPPLEVQSAERAAVDIDTPILYRFLPNEKAGVSGGPRDLFKIGADPVRWRTAVQLAAQARLLETLRVLRTAEFYLHEKREPLLERAKLEMNHELNKQGINIDAVLMRRFSYRDPKIEKAIFDKNIQEQDRAASIAQQGFLKAQGDAKKREAEMRAKIDSLKVEAESSARVLRSQGDLYEASKKAEADLLVARSRAEVDKLRAGALAQSAGASVYVGREIAPLLASLKGGVVSGIDPYDLTQWSKRFGVEGK